MVDVEDRDPLVRRRDRGGRSPRSGARCGRGRSSPRRGRARARPRRARRVGIARAAPRPRRRGLDAEVVDEDARLAGDDDAAARPRARRDDRHAARRGLDHRPPELRAPRRRHDDVARLVEVRRVLRERDEADVVRQPELVDESLRLRLVVPRQVGELERAADDRAEELLAAHGAADDQVARVEPSVAQARGRLDELVEALRRVDEAEVGDDRAVRRAARAPPSRRGVARAGSARGRRSSGRPSSRRRRRSPTSWLIAIDVVASLRIAARTNAERRSLPPSGSAERRCQTTGRPSRRASHAAGISGESLKWTSSNRWRRSVRRNWSTCCGSSASSRTNSSQRRPR